MKNAVLLLCVSLSLISCRNVEEVTGKTPIIETRGVDMAMYEYDLQECRNYADQVQVGRQTTAAAATGAVTGGVIGAVVGNSGSVATGAGVGAVTGTVAGVSSGLRERERVIRNCLIGRGYRVLN